MCSFGQSISKLVGVLFKWNRNIATSASIRKKLFCGLNKATNRCLHGCIGERLIRLPGKECMNKGGFAVPDGIAKDYVLIDVLRHFLACKNRNRVVLTDPIIIPR
ncbi:hypothetical protein VIBNISFn118_940048 [Vibrio nigripulchritudo SFn118]|nr:hypothetical protein VIBNISFn118_940048 [Vibrio nigripulchritudo SFn118]